MTKPRVASRYFANSPKKTKYFFRTQKMGEHLIMGGVTEINLCRKKCNKNINHTNKGAPLHFRFSSTTRAQNEWQLDFTTLQQVFHGQC